MIKSAIRYVKQHVENPYKTAQTKNFEGHPSWFMDGKDRLNQLMMTGTLTNTFYVEQKSLIESTVDFIEFMCKEDAALVARSIVLGRQRGFIRTLPILSLVILSKYNTELFKSIFDQIILTGNDLEDFINFVNSSGRKFGRSLKTSMNRWYDKNLNEFYAIKYRNQIGRAIRISRPRSSDPIYGYVLGAVKDINNISDFESSLERYQKLKDWETVKQLIGCDKWNDMIPYIERSSISGKSLWDYIGGKKAPPIVWRSVGEQLGVFQYIKLLNKLLRESAVDSDTMKAKVNVESLTNAKIFPFRLYTAYKNIDISLDNGFRSIKVKNYLADVLEDYSSKYDWSNSNWGNKSYVMAPDISASMGYSMAHAGRSVRPCVIAGMFSGFLYKYLSNSILLPWSNSVKLGVVKPKSDSLITHINSIETSSSGGTFMESPIKFCIEKNIKTDVFILITDNEEWGEGWITGWIEYKRDNPMAKAIMIRVDPYPHRPFSDEQSEKYDIYQIFGWSDGVFEFIENVVFK